MDTRNKKRRGRVNVFKKNYIASDLIAIIQLTGTQIAIRQLTGIQISSSIETNTCPKSALSLWPRLLVIVDSLIWTFQNEPKWAQDQKKNTRMVRSPHIYNWNRLFWVFSGDLGKAESNFCSYVVSLKFT